MIRTVIKPNKRQIKLEIPEEYVGKELEITYLPLDEVNKSTTKPTKSMRDFWGSMSDDTAKKFHEYVQQSRDERERSF